MAAKSDKIIFVMSDEVRAVRGVYQPDEPETGSRSYIKPSSGELFKTLEPVEVGDIVVVESGTRTGFSTVKITEVDCDFDYESEEPCRWIVHKVDRDRFNSLVEKEHGIIAGVKNVQRQQERARMQAALSGGDPEVLQKLAVTFDTDIE